MALTTAASVPAEVRAGTTTSRRLNRFRLKLAPVRRRRVGLALRLLAAALMLVALGCADNSSSDEPSEPDTTETASTDAAPATTAAAPPSTTPTEVIVNVKVTQIPGGPRESTVSALREGMTAPLLPEPLVSPLDVLSGGPPPDGIPSIDAPEFERATDVGFLQPQEAVVTLTLNGDARAYPVQVLLWHEIVNDTVGGEPVTITYCPLCNTAIGYYRQLDDRIFDFGTSGRLYNSALVMYDRQTESLWAHYTGQAIAGALTGSQLELIPMATVAFETFLDEHPNGLVMTRPGGFGRSYGTNPYVNYDTPNGSPTFFGGPPDDRLPPQTRVLVIRHGGASVAVQLDTLSSAGVLPLDLGGTPVVAFHLPGTATPIQNQQVAFGRDVGATGVFDPIVDGQALTFSRMPDAASSSGPGAFTDDQTGSTWSILGRALDGPLAGAQLQPIEHIDTFWFAAAAYDPDIDLLDAP
ncbi:DUF3179 domain-containing protein [Candidatus Poriferisodalis sp.]|uniref:DUF3179 domain-containing protein n=1 Tax=Candidatus Poriferisodalis sp. TaxID=3101277 RepID=UPI003B594A61